MSFTKKWIIDDAPLKEDEILTSLDLFSEETTMNNQVPSRRIIEAQLILGKYHLYKLTDTLKINQDEVSLKKISKGFDFHLVEIPFTIYSPPGDKYYEEVLFQVKLASTMTTAFDLLPLSITMEQETKKTYELSTDLKFSILNQQVEGNTKASQGYEIQFTSIKPIITAFGLGKNEFHWLIQCQKGEKILPGSRRFFVVLEVPQGKEEITGIVQYEMKMHYNWLNGWRTKAIKTEQYPFEWRFR